jgi:hypothetical protein
MKETYRFWSLDPLYLGITKTIIDEHGVRIRKDDFRELWLYHGNVYGLGKADGRAYPHGSNPAHPNARNSHPATLEIITESSDKLVHLEKEWGIGKDVPRDSQRQLLPSEEWDAREVLKNNSI